MKNVFTFLSICLLSATGFAKAQNSVVGTWELEQITCQNKKGEVIKNSWANTLVPLAADGIYELKENGKFKISSRVPLTCETILTGDYTYQNGILKLAIQNTEKIDGSLFNCSSKGNSLRSISNLPLKLYNNSFLLYIERFQVEEGWTLLDEEEKSSCKKGEAVQVFNKISN